MSDDRSTFGFIGIGAGSIALMLALLHFWAGPFSPQPTLEQVVADKAVSIRDATVAALRGESAPEPERVSRERNMDDVARIATAFLGGLAVILAVVGIARKEPVRVAGGAAVLGVGAIAFQFAVVALGVFVIVTLVSVVLGEIGFD